MLLSACTLFAGFAQWEPAGDKIKTTWSEQVNPNEVLPEYPHKNTGVSIKKCSFTPLNYPVTY